MTSPSRQSGFSKLEFAVVLVIFGVLGHLLLDRLVALEYETERLEVSLTIRHINLGLKLAAGEHIMRGEDARIPALLEQNPLNFLGQKVSTDQTAAGHWNYVSEQRILSYRPRQPEAFDGQTRLEWRFTAYPNLRGGLADLKLEPLK